MKKMIITVSLLLSSNAFACMGGSYNMCVLTPAPIGLALQNKEVVEKLQDKQNIRHFATNVADNHLEIATSDENGIDVKYKNTQLNNVHQKSIRMNKRVSWMVRISDYPLLVKLLVSPQLQELLQKATEQTGASVTFKYMGVQSDKYQTPVIFLGTPSADGKNVESNNLKIQGVLDENGELKTAVLVPQ